MRAARTATLLLALLPALSWAQQTAPAQGGSLAAMFHKETVSDALQGCAMLIAGWNQGRVDDAGLTRTTKALRALDLPDLAARVEKLRQIADA